MLVNITHFDSNIKFRQGEEIIKMTLGGNEKKNSCCCKTCTLPNCHGETCSNIKTTVEVAPDEIKKIEIEDDKNRSLR